MQYKQFFFTASLTRPFRTQNKKETFLTRFYNDTKKLVKMMF